MYVQKATILVQQGAKYNITALFIKLIQQLYVHKYRRSVAQIHSYNYSEIIRAQ
jgi:hypothetical protein